MLQILVNIIQNAKDAVHESTNKDKKIKFEVKPESKSHIKIQISDNGIGISPENLERIFAFGFTTKPHGHGFGLHSCALAAKEMNGSLKADSKGPKEGAIFILTLPAKTKSGRVLHE